MRLSVCGCVITACDNVRARVRSKACASSPPQRHGSAPSRRLLTSQSSSRTRLRFHWAPSRTMLGAVYLPVLLFSSATILVRMSQLQQWFYAVGRGRQVGVYTTWAECLKQVENLANAKFRKFKTHKEAVAFIQECKEKYSPQKSPPRSQFLRDTINLPTASVPTITSSQQPSSSQFAKPLVSRNMFYSQQTASNSSESVTSSQRQTRNNTLYVSKAQETGTDVPRAQTLSVVQSSAEEDPFMPEHLEQNTQNNTVMNGTEVDGFSMILEKVEKHFTEIKGTLDQILLRMNDLENRVQEISCQNATNNQSDGVRNIAGSSVKRSLLESYNVPQPVGSRHFSTTQPNEEVEIVPVPPKKIPKIELNSDDEADGFTHDFKVNEDGYVIVYTDGACEKNGRAGAKAGIGVWFGDGHPLNCSEPVHGRPTSNTAEIQAAVQALEIAKRAGVKKILVHTDSEFTINCVTKWVHRWLKNNWKVSTGNNVKNKEDLILLLEAMKGVDVKWEHVRGHQGIHGNEMADRLARSGAERYKP